MCRLGRRNPRSLWLGFRTQKGLTDELQQVVRDAPLDREFANELLARVLNELHPYVRHRAHHATGLFLKASEQLQRKRKYPTADRLRGGFLVLSWFEPLGRWASPAVSPAWWGVRNETAIRRGLREKILLPRPRRADRCAEAGCAWTDSSKLQYDHVKPTFYEIVNQCMASVTKAELQGRFGYSPFREGVFTLADCIPDEHPAVVRLHELHQGAQWQWLCPLHHREKSIREVRSRARKN